MRIQHNIMAMNAYRNFTNNTSALSKNLEKLSSGYKINRAGDDAAGLAISEKMRAQITGLETAQKNAKDGISLVQTAEGALTEVHDMLNRMVELANQSANGTYDNETDRAQMQKEIMQLKSEIDRIADSSNFNGIKLLDGSLDGKISNAMGSISDALNLGDGMTINAPVEGAGVKASVDITFNAEGNTLFGKGDSLSFKIKDADGNEKTLQFNYDAADTDGATGAPGDTTLKGKFAGATFEEQMTSLKNALNATSDLGEYTAELKTELDADGNEIVTGVTLTAKTEAVPEQTIVANSVAATDIQVTASPTTTNGANYATADAVQNEQMGWNDLLGGATSTMEIAEGDTLTFNFTVNGKAQTITLEAGKDFQIGDAAGTVAATTKNIVDALNAASFDDIDGTGIDESLLKASDYFTFAENKKNDGTASNGSIQVVGVDGKSPNHVNTVGNAILTHDVASVTVSGTNAAGSGGTAASGTVAAKQKTEVTFNNDFSVGDKVKLQGTLSDGRAFEVILEAVSGTPAADAKNQFSMDTFSGAPSSNVIDNIVAALKSGNTKVMVKNGDNSVSEVTADKLFDGSEFDVSKASGKLEIESAVAGVPQKGLAGAINHVETINNKRLVATGTETAQGKAPSTAVNRITFDPEKVEQGTRVEIDGKTYEFVTDSKFLSDQRNIAIVLDNLGKRGTDGELTTDAATGADIANALKNALDAQDGNTTPDQYVGANGKKYNLSVDINDGSLKIESVDVGSAGESVSVAAVADNRAASVVKFQTTEVGTLSNPKQELNVKVGDTVTINGKTYEFTDGVHRTKEEGNIGVSLKDITTAQEAAHALADAVNEKDGGKVIATVDEKNGSVVLTSKYNLDADIAKKEDPFAAPEVTLPKNSTGLKLQIGDTSEEFNQLTVFIKDMHAASLGIEDLSVATQEAADKAVTAIKSAINQVSDVRGTLGATQNRLDHTINNLSVMQENIQDAESTIRDVDVAKEMMAYTKNNILIQSAQAMLAQANQVPQGVLQLLQ